jgi:hypothetical protein
MIKSPKQLENLVDRRFDYIIHTACPLFESEKDED